MTAAEITNLIAALTALTLAVGGVITAIKVLREVKVGNEKADAIHRQLNSAKDASDRYQQDLRSALQIAGVPIPDDKSLDDRKAAP